MRFLHIYEVGDFFWAGLFEERGFRGRGGSPIVTKISVDQNLLISPTSYIAQSKKPDI